MSVTTYEDTYKPCTSCDHGTFVRYSNDGSLRCRYCGETKTVRTAAAAVKTAATQKEKTSG